MLPRFTRVLGCVIAAGALTVGLAGPAAAHVTVNPEEGVQGDWTKLAFSVPNEEEQADTVEVRVQIPTDPPFGSVRVKPHPGWTAEVSERKPDKSEQSGEYAPDMVVTAITWTADKGNGIAPGEFDEFEVSVGPLPEQESVSFPATQTYDDGTVVKWDQPMGDDGAEPEHPAPTLTLAAAEAGGSGHHSGTEQAAETDQSSHAETEPAASVTANDTTARTLGALGLGVGVLCLVVLVFSTVAGRRRGSS